MIDFNISKLKLVIMLGVTLGLNSTVYSNGNEMLGSTQIPTPPDIAAPESTCGTTIDWQDVEAYNGNLGPTIDFVNSHQGAVGQVVWNDNLAALYANPGNVNGTRWCTGTLLNNNMFITAGHCFDQQINNNDGWDAPIDDATGLTITSAQHATNMHIEFNYQNDVNGDLQTSTAFDIANLLEYRLGGLDFAILQLSGNPIEQFSFANLTADIPEIGDQLTIIQHPNGIPKVIDAGEYDDVETNGGLINYMRYTNVDTSGGSSGSGVINDNGEIMGVHTNAGCSASGGANHGVLNSDIELVSNEVAQRIDNDNDGLSNWFEREIGTNVDLEDTDSDGMSDKWESDNALDPLSSNDAWFDADFDGYTNLEEFEGDSDPNDADSTPLTHLAAILVPIIGLILN